MFKSISAGVHCSHKTEFSWYTLFALGLQGELSYGPNISQLHLEHLKHIYEEVHIEENYDQDGSDRHHI